MSKIQIGICSSSKENYQIVVEIYLNTLVNKTLVRMTTTELLDFKESLQDILLDLTEHLNACKSEEPINA